MGSKSRLFIQKVFTNSGTILFSCAALAMFAATIHNHLLLHFISNLVTIIITSCMFAVVWVVRHRIDNGYFVILGVGLIFSAWFDLLHILTFEGMQAFQFTNPNLSLYYRLSGRFLQALTLILATICAGKRPNIRLAGLSFAIFSGGLTLLVFRGFFPPILDPQQMTLAKPLLFISIESVILATFAIAWYRLSRSKAAFDRRIYHLLGASIFTAILSEITIALNIHENNLVSVIGIGLKIASSAIAFHTILIIGVHRPQSVFYRNLLASWEQMQNLVHNIHEGIAILNAQGSFLFSNPAADQIFGLQNFSLQGRKIQDLAPGNSSDFASLFVFPPQDTSTVTHVLSLPRKGHIPRTIIATLSPYPDAEAGVIFFAVLQDITERQIEEQKLLDASRLYQTLFMDAPVRIWENDYSGLLPALEQLKKAGVKNFRTYFASHPRKVKDLIAMVRVTNFNKLFKQDFLTGKNDEEHLSPDQIFSQESLLYFIEVLVAIAAGRSTLSCEMTTRTAAGRLRYSNINWTVLPGFENNYARVIISADDVTFQHDTAEKLRASEEKFRLLFDNAGVGIGYYDLQGKLLDFNQKSLEHMGGQLADYIGRGAEDIYGKEWGERICERIRQASRSDRSLDYEDILNLPTGGKWFVSSYMRILDSTGSCAGVQIISTDITRVKQLEQESQYLARFPDENPDPVIRISREGQVIYTNSSGQAILEKWLTSPQGKVAPKIRKRVEECLSTRESLLVEVPLKENYFSIQFVPIPELGYVNMYGRDITALKKTQKDLQRYTKDLEKVVQTKSTELIAAQEKLFRQEKLAILGQLASSVSHELRNPLAVINNSVYMLKAAFHGQDDAAKEYLNIIDQEVAASNKIITDLLTFTRIKPAVTVASDAQTLIERVLRKFDPPDGVKVRIQVPKNLPAMLADDKQIEQVIINIVTNAYQVMPKGGTLDIQAGMKQGLLQFEFCDNGEGIPADSLDQVFEPLYSTKTKGIGLGLTISRMLVEANGGKISAASRIGKGTTFTILLPKAPSDFTT